MSALAASIAGGLVLCTALPAAAQVADEERLPEPEWIDGFYPFGREGPYFGFGAHYALENFDDEPPVDTGTTQGNISGKDGGGIQVLGGYRVFPRFAAELLFQYSWGFEVEQGTVDDQFNAWSLTANAKLYPFIGRWQPYAVAGFGALVLDGKNGDDAGFVSRVGGGLDMYVTDSFLVAFESAYHFPGGTISEFQFATFALSLQYRY